MPEQPGFKAAFPYQRDILALPVVDLDAAARWYTKCFGMVEVERRDQPGTSMKTLPYSQFARLRMRRLVPKSVNVIEHDGWEWMNGTWRYEGMGFTWFGRLETRPRATAGLEIYFEELSAASARSLLKAAGLPVSPGMRLAELRARLGDPVSVDQFVSDRKTYSFVIGRASRYRVGCTIHRRHGLIHVSAIREDVHEQLNAA